MILARRLNRVFGIEIDSCTRCGGTLKIIASVEESEVLVKFLSHLQRSAPERYSAVLPLGVPAPSAWCRLP